MKVIKFKPEPTFNYHLVKIAREYRGLSIADVAEKTKIEKATLARIEEGDQVISNEEIAVLSKVLQFPNSYFLLSATPYDFDNSFYRKKLSVSKKETRKAEASINLAKINFEQLLHMVELPGPNFPKYDLNEFKYVEDCAIHLRKFWNLPHGYVSNLSGLLEKNGIVIINMDLDGADIDGHAIITEDNVPIIFINKDLSADRYRMTLAHELAHLVLHLGQDVSEDRDPEKEAFSFAGEFLMPEREIVCDLSEVKLEKLKELKKYWKVSMGALIQRAYALGVITTSQYKSLWIQMSKAGYKTREPEELDFEREEPSILDELFEVHIQELEFSPKELAEYLGLQVKEMKKKYFPPHLLRKEKKHFSLSMA